ncbi:MAG TPA: ThuA domain-containing protein, partial [Pirellulaceae bacterium]|nr:ThuA domain-containing protein [Pirellulaceae bacterium]
GLVLVHFANGAWNFSLPMAGESDWPEYRKIVRRVWNHHGMGDAKSGHDAFGKFSVKPTALVSPITAGLQPFEVTDELYFRQDGPEPVEPLITAKSKVTDRDEPLAWTYSYGKGRVFQTLLGHSEKTYDTFEPREMLRRAVAWCANRPPRQLDPSLDVVAANGAGANAGAGGGGAPTGAPANTPPAQLKLAEGRFGQALDTAVGGAHMAGKDEYRKPPLTLECWAKLKRQPGYHILAAQELKSSATHWELFAMAGSGHLTVYLPGMNPDHVRSTVNIVDEQWHYLAMIYEPTRVRLFVDGKQVADTQVASKNGESVPGGLAIGQLVGREIGSDGLIDDVRLSRGARDIRGVPTAPLPVDEQTIGLWRFDHFDDRRAAPDESPLKNPGKVADASAPGGGGGPKPTRAQQVADAARMNDHFGAASVGFNWTEQDSVDDRWNKTDVGPMLASTVPLPGVGVVRKGLSIRVGERGEGTFCYDTGQVACRAGWLDGFLKFNPARFGLISSPIPGGKVQFAVADGPGWESDAKDAKPKYRGLHRQGQRSVVECEIADAVVREAPWLESVDSLRVFTRAFEVGPRASGLRLRVGPVDGIRAALKREGQDVVVVERDADVVVFAIRGPVSLTWDSLENGRFGVVVPMSESPSHFTVATVVAQKSELARAIAAVRSVAPVTAARFQDWLRPGPAIWTQPIVTRGVRAPDDAPYVLDSLTLPHDNPYRALMFASGHDFFRNGDMALSTAHGDVWRVSGVDASLQRLEWKRFATGLFQPLGLRIVDDVVYVLGRDQITRLVDRNGDGEADDYENFHSDIETSPGGHDYVACLETDSRGDFYLVHANQGVVRVSRDGRRSESIANGLRNPNGLGIGPGDVITAAPQEGNWTPGSCVFEVRQGGYYGFGGPRVTAQRPLGYDPPLCWIPRMQDNSSGGQVWVTSEKWGPLNGQLLHFSYGKCRMMQVLRDTTTGVSQGATLDLPIDFASGVMRGRFSPHDGQLYASGLKGWVSSAVQDGCLQRVRYTGRAVCRPVAFRTRANALELDFAAPLDKAFCEDPDNFHVQRWNYRYSGDYGSADFKLSDPKQEGRDEVEVRSSNVIADGRTLVLEIPDLKPAM